MYIYICRYRYVDMCVCVVCSGLSVKLAAAIAYDHALA